MPKWRQPNVRDPTQYSTSNALANNICRGPDHGHINMTRHIKASEFKAKCLALIDEVARTGIAVIITKNGKPVAELVPHRPRKQNRPRKQSARGILNGELFITGDIISPIDAECEALK